MSEQTHETTHDHKNDFDNKRMTEEKDALLQDDQFKALQDELRTRFDGLPEYEDLEALKS